MALPTPAPWKITKAGEKAADNMKKLLAILPVSLLPFSFAAADEEFFFVS